MDKKLKGSDLTRTMLNYGYKEIERAISDESYEQAMMDSDFTTYIVAFENSYF